MKITEGRLRLSARAAACYPAVARAFAIHQKRFPLIVASVRRERPMAYGTASRSGAVCVPPMPDGVDFHGVLVLVDAVNDPVGPASC